MASDSGWEDVPVEESEGWQDVSAEPAPPAEPVSPHQPGGPTPDFADFGSRVEAGVRGANNLGLFGSWQDEAAGAVGAGAYAVAKAIRDIGQGGFPGNPRTQKPGELSVGEVYDKVRQSALDREKQSFEEHPTEYRAGEAASFLGQGGGKALAAIAKAPFATPALIRALSTPEGWAAAGKLGLFGGASGALAGGATGAVQEAGAAEPGERLAAAGRGAKFGALAGGALGGTMGAVGGALETDLARRAGSAQRAAGAARQLENAETDAIRATEQNAANKAAYDKALGEHEAEVERLRSQHRADEFQAADERFQLEKPGREAATKAQDEYLAKQVAVGDQNARSQAAYEQALAEHEAEVGRLRDQHAADVHEAAGARDTVAQRAETQRQAAQTAQDEAYSGQVSEVERANAAARQKALEESRRPTEANAARVFGLDAMKNAERADESAQALLQQPGLVDRIMAADPKQGLALIRGLKGEAGNALGAIRGQLAATGATVNVAPAMSELEQSFGRLPSEVRQQAIGAVYDLIEGRAQLDAGKLRQAIDNLTPLSKYGVTLSNGTRVAETAPVFRRARGLLLELEKGAVQQHLGDKALPAYDDALRKFAIFSDAETGAAAKFKRVQRGQEPIRFDKPAEVDELPLPERPAPAPLEGAPYKAKVAEPGLPEAPERPEKLPMPERPALFKSPVYDAKVAAPGLPEAPARPEKIQAMSPKNARELQQTVEAEAGPGGRVRKWMAGAAGRALGGRIGGEVAKAFVGSLLRQGALSADQLEKLSAGRLEKLEKFRGVIARAASEGPAAVAVAHRILTEKYPDYAEAFRPDEGEVRVTAHRWTAEEAEKTPIAERVESATMEDPDPQGQSAGYVGPNLAEEDVVSTPAQDRVVLDFLRNNPINPTERKEQGWLLHQNEAGDLDVADSVGEHVQGEVDHTDFRWTPSKDRVTGMIHTHSPKLGDAKLNKANRRPSPGDRETLGKARVPSYVLGTDGKVRVLERVGGKIFERVLGDPKAPDEKPERWGVTG